MIHDVDYPNQCIEEAVENLPVDSISAVYKDFHQMISDGRSLHSKMAPQPGLSAKQFVLH